MDVTFVASTFGVKQVSAILKSTLTEATASKSNNELSQKWPGGVDSDRGSQTQDENSNSNKGAPLPLLQQRVYTGHKVLSSVQPAVLVLQ